MPILFLLLAFAGFLDATYLAAKHYLGSPVTCSLLKGCETVTASQYSVVFGVSVALFGSLYYLTLLVLTIVYFDTKKLNALIAAGYTTAFGLVASLYFVYLQIFVIHALCLYCLLSATTSTILFVLGCIVIHRSRPLNIPQ